MNRINGTGPGIPLSYLCAIKPQLDPLIDAEKAGRVDQHAVRSKFMELLKAECSMVRDREESPQVLYPWHEIEARLERFAYDQLVREVLESCESRSPSQPADGGRSALSMDGASGAEEDREKNDAPIDHFEAIAPQINTNTGEDGNAPDNTDQSVRASEANDRIWCDVCGAYYAASAVRGAECPLGHSVE